MSTPLFTNICSVFNYTINNVTKKDFLEIFKGSIEVILGGLQALETLLLRRSWQNKVFPASPKWGLTLYEFVYKAKVFVFLTDRINIK